MSDTGIQPFLQKPGSVDLTELFLLLPGGAVIDLTDYLVEFGLYEDLFNSTLSAYVVISDSRNLVATLPIIGDEYVQISFITPELPEDNRIKRAFKIFSISNRKIVRDTNTTLYTLELCSPELEKDSTQVVYDFYDEVNLIPNITDKVFEKYLTHPRSAYVDAIKLTWEWGSSSTIKYNTEPSTNGGKIISPAWSPFKLMNWLASKAISPSLLANNYLFYETNKTFKFYHIETLISDQLSKPVGPYTYYGTGIPDKEVSDLLLRVQGLELDVTNDSLNNTHSGYYANQLITLDLFKKEVNYNRYDHIDSFTKYTHTNGNESKLATFGNNVKRFTDVYTKIYPINSKLFQKKDPKCGNNLNEDMPKTFGNRHSTLQDLSNLKIRIVIPGRTDIEVGTLIKFRLPNLSTRSEEDVASDLFDTLYTGNYLITSIRHKILAGEHIMICEMVTDSLLTTMVVA